MTDPSQDRDATSLPTLLGRRTASTLLPAFEPLSSSPALPRPLKRTRDALDDLPTYPTPLPTSSTAILSSSPTRANATRLPATRPTSNQSERAPLASVPSTQLSGDGQPFRLGRSSVSCDLQLSANRAISRLHVLAWYRAAANIMELDRVFIKCVGWNPITVHAGGKMFDLRKDQDFSTDVRDTEILVDVQGSRVRIHWPDKPRLGPVSSDEDEPSPSKRPRAMLRHSTPPSPSPAQSRRRPVSPVSPSPAVQAVQAILPSSPPLPPREPALDPRTTPPVDIYEDPEPEEQDVEPASTADPSQAATNILTQTQNTSMKTQESFATPDAACSDNDEENDPIIISFGPAGDNLLPRMQSFNTGSPTTRSKTPKHQSSPSHLDPAPSPHSPAQTKGLSMPQSPGFDVKEHIINQLAFSRLSSTPLSTILGNFPHDAGYVSKTALQKTLDDMVCVGEVIREGKDAAGKHLESEYYYIPEKDEDEKRKEAVVNDLMKPGLRACRKQHKQYFWKKPK